MPRLGAALARVAATLLWLLPAAVPAASTPSLFAEEARLTGRMIPDAQLQLNDGRVVALSTLWQDRPLLLTLFYRRCTGTCEPLLLSVRDATAQIGGLGRDYRILGLSFAESDTAEDMRTQAQALGLEHDPDWMFAITQPADMRRIAEAVGFWFRPDATTGQYDHPTLLIGVDHGRIVRALAGYPVSHERFRELIWELRGRFVPYYQLPGQSSLRCFQYDPRTGALRPDWGLLLLAIPGAVALTATVVIFARRPRPGHSTGMAPDRPAPAGT